MNLALTSPDKAYQPDTINEAASTRSRVQRPGAGDRVMAAELRISPRERLILTAILEMYIATGEPVPSQAVARIYADKEGMSSATIRNVMATLSEAGLLEQPHTSA